MMDSLQEGGGYFPVVLKGLFFQWCWRTTRSPGLAQRLPWKTEQIRTDAARGCSLILGTALWEEQV